MSIQKFSEETIEAVWEKAKIVPSYDPGTWRKDICGAWIKRQEYGNRNSNRGWEVDHILSTSNGGSDDLSNLQPLHWRNNDAKGDGRLVCAVTG